MNEKELLKNLDNIPINQSAKNKIRKMIERGENVKERKGEREELAKMIAVELKEIIPDSKQWLEVLKQLKIPEVKTPKVPEVKIPEIKIPDIIIPEIKIPKIEAPEIPEIKIPEIKIPDIKMPKIEMPSVNIPKEMEVKGIRQFFEKTIKSINDIIKNKFSVVIHGGISNHGTVERDNPLPVIPVDENGKIIKGGGGIGFVKGGGMAGGATEEKQDDMFDILNDVHCPLCNALQTIEYYPSIAENKITDYSRGSIIGSQNVIGTAGFAILSNVVAVQPSGDTQMQVVSDSVEDAAGGTGALEVTITYLPYAWSSTFKTEVVVLNGTTTINTIATDIYRIEEFRVNKASGMAVGNITLKSTDGVTLYAQIDAGRNFFERAIHYVRTGYKAVVTGVIIGCSTNGGVIWRLFRSTEDSDGNVIPLGRYSIEVADNTLPYTANIPVVCSNPNGKRMATGLAVLGRNANQKGTGSCRFYDLPI